MVGPRGGGAAALIVAAAYADVYMHNPRGSNDRNCERNARGGAESPQAESTFRRTEREWRSPSTRAGARRATRLRFR